MISNLIKNGVSLGLSILCLIAFQQVAWGDTLDESVARLRYHYRVLSERLANDPGALPFTVEAERAQGQVRSLSRFVLEDVTFDDLADILGSLPGWCESLLLHLNVKACVHHDLQPRFLELYLGRKYYQHPAESVRLDLRFDSERTEKALRARLTADAGPYGTSQYEFVLTAIDAGSDVFVELKLSNDEGYAGGLIDLYLNTLGRYKVGFTEVGKSMFGNTKYITGQEGAAERNVVRYMYALSVSLERSKEPFDERAKAWFDATERHPRQLQELERDRYLAIKQREYENQLLYQRAADRGEVIELEKPTKNR